MSAQCVRQAKSGQWTASLTERPYGSKIDVIHWPNVCRTFAKQMPNEMLHNELEEANRTRGSEQMRPIDSSPLGREYQSFSTLAQAATLSASIRATEVVC